MCPSPNRVVVTAIATALLVAPAVARGQGASAQAEQLFRDGRRLMEEKNYPAACDAFEASQKLEAMASTLMNLANCREKNGQLATAWARYLEVERLTRGSAKHDKLRESAHDKAEAIEPKLSYLIVNVPDESRVDGLVITRNGETVDPLTWNRALPVDGGTYVIEGKAPGHEAWSTKVTVGTAYDKESVDVPRFKAVTLPEPEQQPEVKPELEEAEALDDELDQPGGLSGRRKAAIALAATGGLGLIGGVVFELGARGAYDDAVLTMDEQRRGHLLDQANSRRTLATFSVGAGVACLAIATVLWLTGGEEADDDARAIRLAPAVDGASVGLVVGGAF